MNKRHQQNKNGYTLIEMVVVVAIAIIVFAAASASIFSTFTSNQRITTGTYVKQQGDFVVTSLETMVRNSLEITDCSASSLTMTNHDGNTTQIVLNDDRIASISGTPVLTAYLTAANTAASDLSMTCTTSRNDAITAVRFSFTLESTDAIGRTGKISSSFEGYASLRRFE